MFDVVVTVLWLCMLTITEGAGDMLLELILLEGDVMTSLSGFPVYEKTCILLVEVGMLDGAVRDRMVVRLCATVDAGGVNAV